ncbi:hypothetical protein [Reyranella sp.]|uniref:hypothetical protein n=1 Tax=Reyranella sp. TaxID=1929291 RepID=UPI003BACFEEB
MPFDGTTRYQIDITAADRTAQAFATVDRRLKAMEVTQRAASAGISAGYALMTRALAPLAAALTATAVVQRVWQAGMEAANLGEQAEQIGLTTDALQAYRLAAAQNGVEVAQLDTAFMRLTKSMGEAAAGSDDAIVRFERLGVRLLDNNGKLRRTSDILPEVAAGLLEIGNQSQRDALMMEIFGRSGARMVTMLETFAQGQNDVVASARDMNAVMGGSVIAAWDKVDDRLKVVNQQMTVFQATVGAPLALGGLTALEWTLRLIASAYRTATEGAIDFGHAAGKAVRGVNVGMIESDIAQLERNIANPPLFLRGGLETMKQQLVEKKKLLDQARAAEEDYRKGVVENRIDRQVGLPQEPPPVTFRDFNLPGKQPIGKQASAAGARLDERLKDLQVERAALEKALAAFDVRGLETVAEVDRRLDAQVKLEQKIAGVLKDVPPNSPLAQQLIQEATAVSQLNARLDERKRLVSEGERVTAQFGDGSREAARATADLNAMLAAGAIDAGTYERALKATTQAADDQARAARGATGGFDGFRAGFEQGMADVSRSNSAFELGRRGVDMLNESIDMLAGTSNRTFGQMAADFGMMLLKWELSAQASNVWNSITGKGPTNQGLFGSLLGGLGDLFGGGGWGIGAVGGSYNGGGSMSFGGPRAAGGPVNPGSWYMVGEKGPEPFIPHTPGTILPNSALRGGGPTVIVNVHNNGNSQVRTEESMGPGGMPRIDVFVDAIDGAFAKKLDRGVGPTSDVLKGRYGLQPVGRR